MDVLPRPESAEVGAVLRQLVYERAEARVVDVFADQAAETGDRALRNAFPVSVEASHLGIEE